MFKKMILMSFMLWISVTYCSFALTDYPCGRGTSTSYTDTTACSYGSRTVNVVVVGHYDTQAEASAAADQSLAALKIQYPNYSAAAINESAYSSLTGVLTNVWGAYRAAVTRCATTGRYAEYRMFYYRLPSWIDLNADCELDDADDCQNQFYQILEEVRDDADALLYARVQLSTGGVVNYGNPNALNNCLINNLECTAVQNSAIDINPETGEGPFNINNDMCGLEADLSPLAESTPGANESETPTAPSGEKGTTGEEGEAGDTDSELLGKIANNTGAIENNTDGLQATADSIEAQLKNINNTLLNQGKAEKTELPGGIVIYETPSSTVITNKQSIDNLSDDAQGALAGYAFTEDDLPEETTTLTSILNYIKNNNPISAFLSRINITSVDEECSISGSFNIGTTPIDIEFSLCEWEEYVDIMGAILYLCAAIYFILIIFK